MKNIGKILIIGVLVLVLIFVGSKNELLAQGGSCGSTYITEVSTKFCNYNSLTDRYSCGVAQAGGTYVRNCYNQGGGCNAVYVTSSTCTGSLPWSCDVSTDTDLESCSSSTPTDIPPTDIPYASPTPSCNPDCSCEADTCVGDTCPNKCGGNCDGKKVELSSCSAITLQYSETPQTTGKVWAKVADCSSYIYGVRFPTWNDYNEQDDIVSYDGTNISSGTWENKVIDISQHQPTLGNTINVHVYNDAVCRAVGLGSTYGGGTTIKINPKTCAVTINTPGAVFTQASGINITATGNAHINPGSDTVRVWISRNDMGVIPGGVTYDYGGSTGIAAVNNGGNFYSIERANLNSVNAANTSATFTVHAPPGNYRVHCDLPSQLDGNDVRCSGNPNCDVNGGSQLCGWKDCSAFDNVSVCIGGGAPNVPVFSNANNRTVTSMPVSFTWSTGGVKTVYYNKSLDAATGVSIGNVLTVSNISVATTGWHNLRVQSVNDICGTDASSWSDPWSAFCYETQNCSPKCGQDLACSTPNCSNDDNGAPGAPTINSPNGASGSPTAISGNAPQAVTLSWNVTAKAEKYLVVLYNSAGLIWSPPATTAISATTNPLVAGIYHWRVSAVNATCPPDQTGSASAWGYFRINSPPVLNLSPTNYLVLQNSVATVVSAEAGNKNQICQTTFANSPATPRQIKLVVTATDAEGGNEISSIVARLNLGTSVNSAGGVTGQWDLVSVSCVTNVNNRICTFHMSLRNALDISTLYNLEASATDIWGATTGWIDSGRDLKIWDCQVPVSGSLYDKTGLTPSCPNWSSLVPSGEDIEFDTLIFKTGNAANVVAVPMDVTPPYSYSSLGVGLTWWKTYQPVFNNGLYPTDPLDIFGDLLAFYINVRVTDAEKGTTTCPMGTSLDIGNSNLSGVYFIDPYSSNPSAKIDFAFVEDQEAWYQVVGAGVKSKGALTYGVPVTVDDPLEALTLSSNLLKIESGLVSAATNLTNINGNNEKFGIAPRNWYVLRNTNDSDIYNYNYFYNNFFVKAGIGSTGSDWDSKPPNGIYFVKNDLNIDSDFVLDDPLNTKTMMVVVNGDITIQPGVTSLDGIYIANGFILAGENNATALTINGMLYARNSVRLNRSFTDKTDNNTAPAVKVNYSPGLIFKLDPKILRVLSGWREE